ATTCTIDVPRYALNPLPGSRATNTAATLPNCVQYGNVAGTAGGVTVDMDDVRTGEHAGLREYATRYAAAQVSAHFDATQEYWSTYSDSYAAWDDFGSVSVFSPTRMFNLRPSTPPWEVIGAPSFLGAVGGAFPDYDTSYVRANDEYGREHYNCFGYDALPGEWGWLAPVTQGMMLARSEYELEAWKHYVGPPRGMQLQMHPMEADVALSPTHQPWRYHVWGGNLQNTFDGQVTGQAEHELLSAFDVYSFGDKSPGRISHIFVEVWHDPRRRYPCSGLEGPKSKRVRGYVWLQGA
ncbi:MAG TPA: hypothetical protein VGW38_09755, partial [Chloroflexota bacterium]|nr:hypothetical protein [Chloroflexota bacterium]